MSCSDTLAQEAGVFGFDARAISKRFRHAAIFGALESLNDGDVMRFQNDHDPLPLLDQIRHRYGDQIKIDYVAREPGNIVIDFRVQLGAYAEAAQQSAGGGCGGNGAGGCGCGN